MKKLVGASIARPFQSSPRLSREIISVRPIESIS
jgi:hypothetical protein